MRIWIRATRGCGPWSSDTLSNDEWKLLWLPASLPYSQNETIAEAGLNDQVAGVFDLECGA